MHTELAFWIWGVWWYHLVCNTFWVVLLLLINVVMFSWSTCIRLCRNGFWPECNALVCSCNALLKVILCKYQTASLGQLLHFLLNSYTLRSILADKDSKVQLAFDLEVVRLRKLSAVGIQCQRLKGDAWYYRRICESILATARLWSGKPVLYWSCNCCRCCFQYSA